jgi:hypothetical protein
VFRRLNGRDQKAKEMENTGFKLWYTGKERSGLAVPTVSFLGSFSPITKERVQILILFFLVNLNGVCIFIDKSLKNEVVAVRRQGDMIIMIKLIFGDLVLNVISAYAPQVV